MKKFIFILFCFICFTSWSQSLSLGPKAYVNISRFTGDLEQPSFILAGTYGVGMNLRLEENLSFELDLLYAQQGTKTLVETDNIGTYDITIKADYIIIPLLVKFHANNTLFLQMGVQPGFLVNGKWNLGGEYKDIKDQMNGFDIGFNLGLGVYITEKLVLDGRYYFGLADVNKTLFSDVTMSNNVIRLGLSYFLPIKDHPKTE